MREDKIIGLTFRAQLFQEKLLKEHKIIRQEIINIQQLAFSDDYLQGLKFWVEPSMPEVNAEEYYEEVLQFDPWCSGPFYFTCFKHVLVKKANQVLELGKCYEWYKDPMIESLFDVKLGCHNL